MTHFRKGLRILIDRKTAAVGITPLAAFFLSSAMRVGPGNIMGVTGAIAVGGPGALFWICLLYTSETILSVYCKNASNSSPVLLHRS